MTTTPAPSLREKFEILETTLNGELVERRNEIYAMILTLVGRTTMFFLGPPGVAKSLAIRRLMTYIDQANYFEILMTRFTQPEELFGPPSLKALENDEFKHSIDGYLPTAQAAMVDEVWKASSSVLNSLLWIINERLYRHGRDIIEVPLGPLYCASNELPGDDSLAALYDRMVFRFQVEPIRDQSSFLTMLKTHRPEHPEPILNWDEVMLAQKECTTVVVPERVLIALAELRSKLRDEKIEPSERRFVQALQVVQAAAWLDNCPEADTDHLAPLANVFWSDPGQIDTVSRLVLEVANPLEVEAQILLSGLKDLETQIAEAQTDDEKMRIGGEVQDKLTAAGEEYEDLKRRAGEGKRRLMKVVEVQDKLEKVIYTALVDIFKFNPDQVNVAKKKFLK